MSLAVEFGRVAPYYNLVLVIVAGGLFLYLFCMAKKAPLFVRPWKILFVALMVFIIEEGLTIARAASLVYIPVHINGFFELLIVVLFVYALLLQKAAMDGTVQKRVPAVHVIQVRKGLHRRAE